MAPEASKPRLFTQPLACNRARNEVGCLRKLDIRALALGHGADDELRGLGNDADGVDFGRAVLRQDIGVHANLNAGNPQVLWDILGENAMVGVWLEHTSEDESARSWIVMGYIVAFSFSLSFCCMHSECSCAGAAGRGTFVRGHCALAHWAA